MNSSVDASEKTSVWNKAFINIFIINIVQNFGQFLAATMLPKYVEHLGATAAMIGVVSGIFGITALSVRPFVGSLTSWFDKKYLLAGTIGIIIMAFLCYGFSDSIQMVIAGRLLQGIGMGFLAPLNLALASNALPAGKLASGIGIFSLGQAVSTAIGPSVAISLTDMYGYPATFFIATGLLCVSLVLALRLKHEKPDRSGPFRISLKNVIAPEVLVPAVMAFFLGGTYSCISSFIVIYGGANGIGNIGLYFTAYAVCLLISRPLSGRIADKYGVDKMIIPGISLFAVSFLVISFSRSLPMFILSGAISAFGYGICQPAMQTLCIMLVPRDRRSVAGNTSYIGTDFGLLVLPALAGSVITFIQGSGGSKVFAYSVMYRIMIIPILIALGIFLFNRVRLMAKIDHQNAERSKKAISLVNDTEQA